MVWRRNFYSHIPCGMWPMCDVNLCTVFKFLLTHPVWDVTSFTPSIVTFPEFLLTHPVWDVTKSLSHHQVFFLGFLLTHPVWDVTLRVYNHRGKLSHFYSHIPCGMWLGLSIIIFRMQEFLLTHPVWDVTHIPTSQAFRLRISTHTSRVGCDVHMLWPKSPIDISTHTSRVGCDGFSDTKSPFVHKFLLTHPVWDVTPSVAPVGTEKKFLLTHPVWDVTSMEKSLYNHANISTHTSRVGCDNQWHLICAVPLYFYSHIPCGMWRNGEWYANDIRNFYSHIPCGMWHQLAVIGSYVINFYSHIPCGMWRLHPVCPYIAARDFYSHIPCGMWRIRLRHF